jgi:8-oxo-dGTP pyrophosphatase MutT (NUDIX family)
MKRQRATVIVEIDGKILLVENRGGMLLLPGGGINADESLAQAAARELAEETGLLSDALQFLFSHESQTNCHHVFRASASGAALAGDDAMALHFFAQEICRSAPGCRRQPDRSLRASRALAIWSALTRYGIN